MQRVTVCTHLKIQAESRKPITTSPRYQVLSVGTLSVAFLHGQDP